MITYTRLDQIEDHPESAGCTPEELTQLAFGYRRWRHLEHWVNQQEAASMERLKDHIHRSGVPDDPRFPVADAIVAYLRDHDPRSKPRGDEPTHR